MTIEIAFPHQQSAVAPTFTTPMKMKLPKAHLALHRSATVVVYVAWNDDNASPVVEARLPVCT